MMLHPKQKRRKSRSIEPHSKDFQTCSMACGSMPEQRSVLSKKAQSSVPSSKSRKALLDSNKNTTTSKLRSQRRQKHMRKSSSPLRFQMIPKSSYEHKNES